MKIAVNVRILNTTAIRGWSRYTYNLIRGLQLRNIPLVLLSDVAINEQWLPAALKGRVIIQPGYNYMHWEQRILPRLVHESGADIFHSPINYGVPYLGKFKKVITIHDAIDRAFYEPLMSRPEKLSWPHVKSRLLHSIAHRACDRVITVSDFSKQQIREFYGVPVEKIDVIYEGAEDHFHASQACSKEALRERFQINPGYFFYVGGLEKRKNIETLLAAAQELRVDGYRFVIAGGNAQSYATRAPDNVHFIGYVSESDLPSLYHHSKAFVHPSFSEGFGLQLVETLKMDRPAVYASGSSLEEIYGTRDWAFDPHDNASLVAVLRRLNENYNIAVSYAQQRKNFFSWDKTIEETIQVYKSILL